MCANSRNVIEIAISFVYRTKQKDKVVCGFSSMERMALVNVEGSGLVGIKGVDKRIFGVLEYHGVNVALISQAVCYSESTLSIFQ